MFPFSHESPQPPTVSAAAAAAAAVGDNSNNCSCKTGCEERGSVGGGRGLGLASSSWRCEALSKFIQFKRRFLFPVSSFYVFSLPVVLHLSPGTCCCCMLHVASAKWVREKEMGEIEREGGREKGRRRKRERTNCACARVQLARKLQIVRRMPRSVAATTCCHCCCCCCRSNSC